MGNNHSQERKKVTVESIQVKENGTVKVVPGVVVSDNSTAPAPVIEV